MSEQDELRRAEWAFREAIRRAKADAWDEGYDVGGNDVGSGWRDNELTKNPYRDR